MSREVKQFLLIVAASVTAGLVLEGIRSHRQSKQG